MSENYNLKDSENFYRNFLDGIILYEKINQMLDSKTDSLNKKWAEKTDITRDQNIPSVLLFSRIYQLTKRRIIKVSCYSYMKKSIERLTK